MSFNFDNFDEDSDDNPFKELGKFFQHIQKDIMRSLQNGNFDENQPNMKKFGFSIHMGPDGTPHITPLNNQNNQKRSGNGFEEPFVDVFYNDETKQYQIIAEVTGVEMEENIHLKADDNEFTIHAESGPNKYKKSMLLKHPIDMNTLDYKLTNGVLEITAKSL